MFRAIKAFRFLPRPISLAILLAVALESGQGVAGEAEVLLGYTIGPDGITYQLTSFGCTAKKHFSAVRQLGSPLVVELIRNTPDLCEQSLRYGTKITFSYKELGIKAGTRFSIGNKLQADLEAP